MLQYQICCRALLISLWYDKELSHSLQKISPGRFFWRKSIESSITIPLFVLWNEGLNLLYAISYNDRANISLQTSFKEFQISQCTKNSHLIHFVLYLPSIISTSSLLPKQDFSLLLCLDSQVNWTNSTTLHRLLVLWKSQVCPFKTL